MLGFYHIIYILLTIAVGVILHIGIINKKINFDKLLKYAAYIALILDPLYWVWEYYNFGYLDLKITLPLYICSLFWYLTPIVAFSKKRGYLYRACISCLCTIVLYGAILGLVLNSHLNNYPFTHFIVQRSLFYHSLMLVVIGLIWSTGYYKVEKKDRFLSFIPLLIIMLPSYIVDKLYGYDYCYFNGGGGTTLDYFSDAMGIPLFVIFIYSLLFSITYLVLSFAYKWQKK